MSDESDSFIGKSTSNQLTLQQILALPLAATVDADFDMSRKFIELIKTYGFESNDIGSGQGNWGKVKTVTFDYSSTNPQGQTVVNTVTLPLLSLIPLPLLEISKADFEMSIQVMPVIDENIEQASINDEGRFFIRRERPVARGTLANLRPINDIASETPQGSAISANLKVNVGLRQADLPNGIASMLNLAQSARQLSVVILKTLTADKAIIQIPDDQEFHTKVVITVTNNEDKTPAAGQPVTIRLKENLPSLEVNFVDGITVTDEAGRVSFCLKESSESDLINDSLIIESPNCLPIQIPVIKKAS